MFHASDMLNYMSNVLIDGLPLAVSATTQTHGTHYTIRRLLGGHSECWRLLPLFHQMCTRIPWLWWKTKQANCFGGNLMWTVLISNEDINEFHFCVCWITCDDDICQCSTNCLVVLTNSTGPATEPTKQHIIMLPMYPKGTKLPALWKIQFE